MEHSMIFQYVPTVCNDKIRVISLCIISHIYHFIVLEAFKILVAVLKYTISCC